MQTQFTKVLTQTRSWLRHYWSPGLTIAIALSIAGLLVSNSFTHVQAGFTNPAMADRVGTASASSLVAYNIDLDMDKAREEKTVEHYGESMRDILQKANRNNENNPEHQPTAKSTYERQSPFNDLLPKQNGSKFTKDELENMEEN